MFQVSQKLVVISIHAPRVGGDGYLAYEGGGEDISIHAPRVGGDHYARMGLDMMQKFQSTPPVWGATHLRCHGHAIFDISIHAPRVGGDRGTGCTR